MRHEELQHTIQSGETMGWITVESFDDEETATRFWQKVRKKSKTDTSALRVRVVRSLLGRESNAVLAVGPFAGPAGDCGSPPQGRRLCRGPGQ